LLSPVGERGASCRGSGARPIRRSPDSDLKDEVDHSSPLKPARVARGRELLPVPERLLLTSSNQRQTLAAGSAECYSRYPRCRRRWCLPRER
jgi:hypothetical protein